MFVIPGWADAAVAARPPSPAIGYQMGSGGAVGDRTPDLCNAIAALSQLSYGPIVAGLEFPAKASPLPRRRDLGKRVLPFLPV